MTTLSTLAVDYNASKDQLRAVLNNSSAQWRAILPTETGDTLLSLIATVNASSQQAIIRAYQDAFPDTAVPDSAIYAAATMQGVRLNRKIPASMQVDLVNSSNTTSVTLTPYTEFSGAGTYWFNRTPLTIPALGTIRAVLYQGKSKTVNLTGIGSPYQLFTSEENQFFVSDVDTSIQINGSDIPRRTDALWLRKNSAGFLDRTLPGGSFLAEFGDGVYGSQPALSAQVRIRYVITNGSSANSINALSKLITCTDNSLISGIAAANPAGGSDETSAARYKNIAASTFGTFDSAVTRNQYVTTILQYPGILDAVTYAQREVDVSDPRWMNLVQVSYINPVGTNWGPTEVTAFINWLQSVVQYTTRFVIVPPTVRTSDVSALLGCYSWANQDEAVTAAKAAITALFQNKQLNYDIMISDMYAAIVGSHTGIEYVDLITPTADLIVSTPDVRAPIATLTSTGGTLTIGSYTYGIGYKSATGVTIRPKNLVYAVADSTNSKINLLWDAVASQVTEYYVYGRTGGQFYKLATVPFVNGQAQYTWEDTGLAVGVAPTVVPGQPITTKAVGYNALGTLTVRAITSDRNSRKGG